MSALYLIVGLVALQRLAELLLARYNTKRLKARGAVEAGAKHYPLFILLHGSWLLAVLLVTPPDEPVHGWLVALLVLLQLGRVWVIVTLGEYWTTRIITLPEQPLIQTGPYRFLRHPNYVIVTAEIAVLPLIFNDWGIAVGWSLANALLLSWRIHVENQALRERERL